AQLILAFAILVIIHEFGHFLFARIFGVKVEKFYMFFNPVTSLFKWKPRKHIGSLNKMMYLDIGAEQEEKDQKALEKASSAFDKAEKKLRDASKRGASASEIAALERECGEADNELKKQIALKTERDREDYELQEKEGWWSRLWGHTEYGIGWLPLGGYCKIGGMIDESMDTAQLKATPQPWEFRSKPAWQRLLIMIAGVLFNFLLAILIYAGIVYATGEKYVEFKEAKLGMAYSPAAQNIGFRDGDIPLAADGEPLSNPVEDRMRMVQAKEVTVLRNGSDTVSISIPEDFIFSLDKEAKSDSVSFNFMMYRLPAKITQVVTGEPAAKAGIKEGDVIIAVDSVPTPSLDVFLPALAGHPGETVSVSVVRGRGLEADTITVPVTLSDGSKMGVGLEIDPSAFFKAEEKHYSLLASIPRGIQMGTDRLSAYAQSMKLVFTKEGAKSVGGFGSIGAIFPEKWNWIAFWNIAAFLSVALAFMNILPIPALDGGHVLFLLYEVITGKKPSEKFLEYAQTVGMVLLILLLLYANGMDIVRLFK
ncbi:MAG: RIP metalloprotease RseP, partial [Muribaculaceae bacterium]|nr:RIP metalloprotease RseP [Muribaculaceae bacterium]